MNCKIAGAGTIEIFKERRRTSINFCGSLENICSGSYVSDDPLLNGGSMNIGMKNTVTTLWQTIPPITDTHCSAVRKCATALIAGR